MTEQEKDPQGQAETQANPGTPERRVYALDGKKLTEEQIAVTFAMTSRRPESFDEIAQQVTESKAADFHDRWVLGYGHASVAEHATLHLAVENVSRIAADQIEDHRFGSYTEKSSRYQVIEPSFYHVPRELDNLPEVKEGYLATVAELFQHYETLLQGTIDYLRQNTHKGSKESDNAFNLRLRRRATDAARNVLPAATLTNIGITVNARSLEHIISKLRSHSLQEVEDIGTELFQQGRKITPTLLKYASASAYYEGQARPHRALPQGSQEELKQLLQVHRAEGYVPPPEAYFQEAGSQGPIAARLLDYDPDGEEKLIAAMLQKEMGLGHEASRLQTISMAESGREVILASAAAGMGPHDPAPREFELVRYRFEFVMDYGAYREFKRHRMLSLFPEAMTVKLGHRIPELITDAHLEEEYEQAMAAANQGYWKLLAARPDTAPYLVTHGHYQRMLVETNLRELYHLFRLRTSRQAHESIREPMLQAMELVRAVQPRLLQNLQLRD